MNKWKVGLVTLIVLLTTACASLSPAPTLSPATPTVMPKTGTIHYFKTVGEDIRDIPFLIALDTLRAQGYTVEQTYLANGALIAAALERGDAKIASFNNETAWKAIAKGVNLRTIMSRYVTAPLIHTKTEFRTCADLDDQAVALGSTSGVTPSLFNLYLKDNCPASKLRILVIPDSKARRAALLTNVVQAAQVDPQDAVEIEHATPGQFHTLVALGKVYPQIQSSGIHVRQEWAMQNPELLKDFIRALLLANRQVTANPEFLVTETVKRLGVDRTVASEAATIHFGYSTWHANGGLTLENIKITLDFLAKLDPTLAPLKPDDVADLSYLNAVLDEIGRK